MRNISVGNKPIIGFANYDRAVDILKKEYGYTETANTCAGCIWYKKAEKICTVNSTYTWPTSAGSKCNHFEKK